MLIDPKQKLRDTHFYNNLLLILSIFASICIITSICLEVGTMYTKKYSRLPEGHILGPIVVKKDNPMVYEVKSYFRGDNESSYISGEVLDENEDTLYEFGKDSWHESGRDSDGYWSESDRNMTAKLVFSEPGTYYVKVSTENHKLSLFNITLSRKNGSGIPHLMLGSYALLLLSIAFVFLNMSWVKEKLIELNDKLEDTSDD